MSVIFRTESIAYKYLRYKNVDLRSRLYSTFQFIAICMILVLGSVFIKDARAGLITVTAQIGAPSGCNLFDAILAAESDTAVGNCSGASGDDVIAITGGLTIINTGILRAGSVSDANTGGSYFPPITTKISIIGFSSKPTTIRRTSTDTYRFFIIYTGGELSLSRVHLDNGYGYPFDGGAILQLCTGSLSLEAAAISNSVGRNGGAVSVDRNVCPNPNSTSISIKNSVLHNNEARPELGSLGGLGGAIHQTFKTRVSIVDSTISGNTAVRTGGGVAGTGSPESELNILNSTLVGNNGGTTGGAIFFIAPPSGIASGNALRILNSIVSGNTSTDRGSEIWVENILNIGAKRFLNNVFGSAASNFGMSTNVPDFLMNNSIHTSDSDGSLSISRIVGPLQDNGGFTLSHDLPRSSPALNRGIDVFFSGPPLFIPQSGCRSATLSDGIGDYRSDQRLVDRPIGKACDIGAIESENGVDNDLCWTIPLRNTRAVSLCL